MSHMTLVESPTGLVHLITQFVPAPSIMTTRCGREVNRDTWSRIRALDDQLGGKMLSSIAKMIELPKCDRCFK